MFHTNQIQLLSLQINHRKIRFARSAGMVSALRLMGIPLSPVMLVGFQSADCATSTSARMETSYALNAKPSIRDTKVLRLQCRSD